MSYTLYKSNGAALTTLGDGLIDTQSTSLTLIGKNVTNFGTAQNDNFVYLLENFASNTQPANMITGQIWFDTTARVLRPVVFDGTNLRPLATMLYSNTTTDTLLNAAGHNFAASTPGDFWFNSSSNQLFVVTSTASDVVLIGPETVQGFDTTKMTSASIADVNGTLHPVMEMIIDGEITGIVSSSQFDPTSKISALGFPTIYRGITFKNYTNNDPYVNSTTDVALYGKTIFLNDHYTQRNINESISGIWDFANGFSTGLISSPNSNTTLNLNANDILISASTVETSASSITPQQDNQTILGSSTKNWANIYTSQLTAAENAGTINGVWTLSVGSGLISGSDGNINIGTSGARFGTVYATVLDPSGTGTLNGNWISQSNMSISPATNNTNNLGAVGSTWANVYATNVTTNQLTGQITLNGGINPAITNTENLGSANLAWGNVYSNTVTSTAVMASTINATTITGGLNLINIADATNNVNITRLDADPTLAHDGNDTLPTQRAVKAYVDYTAQQVETYAANLLPPLDTDPSLAADSDIHIASQKAIKTYVDHLIANLQSEINSTPSGIFGVSQTYVNETSNRTFGTPYTNTSNRVIWVSATVSSPDLDFDDPYIWALAFVDGAEIVRQFSIRGGPGWMNLQFFVPPGSSYFINIYCPDEPVNNLSYGQNIVNWIEYK